MAVIRIEKNKNYTVMSNYHLRDTNLSLKAKGLLSIMLSLPDGWHYSIRGLASICKEGITSISSTLKELESNGYMKRYQPTVDGKFQEIEYIIYETPYDSHEQEKTSNTMDIPSTLYEDATPITTPHNSITYSELPRTENPNTVNADTESAYPVEPNTLNQHAYKRKIQVNTELQTTEEQNTNPSINPEHRKDRWIDHALHSERKNVPARDIPVSAEQEWDLYRSIIMDNIGFDDLCVAHPEQKTLIEGILDIITGAVCSSAKTIRIDQEDIPQPIVKSRLLKLNFQHIEYVLLCFIKQHQKIHRIDRYLLTMLYKAPVTHHAFYTNWVNSTEFAQS